MNQNKTLTPNRHELYPKPTQSPLVRIIQQPKFLIPLGFGITVSGGLILFHSMGLALVSFALTLLWVIAQAASSRSKLRSDLQVLELNDPLRLLKRTLNKAQYFENTDSTFAERALSQYEQILKRREHFRKLLDLQFEKTELTYDRYLSAAEQVCEAVLKNLEKMSLFLTNLDSIGLPQVKSELARSEKLGKSESREIDSLKERMTLGSRLEGDIRQLLGHNETALTEFDRVISAVSQIKTSKSGGTSDLDQIMTTLQELADRAKKYSL